MNANLRFRDKEEMQRDLEDSIGAIVKQYTQKQVQPFTSAPFEGVHINGKVLAVVIIIVIMLFFIIKLYIRQMKMEFMLMNLMPRHAMSY